MGSQVKNGVYLTVSRKWNHPEIKVVLSSQEIGLSISKEDLIKALLEELGNPTLLVTQGQLERRLRAAFAAVEKGVKQESIKVML